ncbi:beta-galactosidase 15-like [Ipomoea triloba]|uniref:beta-galactosidase 15-like n=1 Tax=Ipomoea triloba TaxID=35885 RepID=UPI00125E2C4D|nr:beta-galactosidase 15-like [Ipomoea triloba]
MASSNTIFALTFLVFASITSLLACAYEVTHDDRAIVINGERRVLLSGAIHYPRSTAQMWPDLMKKAKEGGLDAIETYVFWNAHEPVRRQYDFSGNHDLIKFIKTCQENGLYVVLRIGPYVCAEWNYGGFPVWLHNRPGLKAFRTNDQVFMREMQNFTTLIVEKVRKEKLFASQGGPIILAQIENEYGNINGPYGDDGKEYINWCAKLANSFGIGVPWIMCQQHDAPEPMLETCNGWYCDRYKPTNPTTPKMWTENWTGWFKSWGGKDPYRTAEDLAYSVARFIQLGGTFQNYYMYHGGTNFGRTAGGPYITTTYDYNAPLDEYGHLNQPKYGHLKELHSVLHSLEKNIVYGNITTTKLDNSIQVTVYGFNGTKTCFFSNANETADATINYQGTDYKVPAWSVSILPDCKTEVYNTAKVNTQTTVMVKEGDKATDEGSAAALRWSWRPEMVDDTILQGKGQFSANQILDQKVANDVSDYIWYMTSVNLDKDDPIWSKDMRLRVNGTGQVLHVYANGKYVDSQWNDYSLFETNIKLNPGKNLLTLLSASIGFQNYGAYFDLGGNGLYGVEIVGKKGDETVSKNLGSHKWSYKVGLHGEQNKLFSSNKNSRSASQWLSDNLPTARRMTWYKTSFKAPAGEDPVVVDLMGLGKGFAWVNGNNLGRYWLILAKGDCPTEPCDYRGPYTNNKCLSNCGNPTQRFYHVPRSFLNHGDNNNNNDLVLFEEIGGTPSLVRFQTVRPGTVCANAYENKAAEISCPGRNITEIKYANFGHTRGTCGGFEKGLCGGAEDAMDILKTACLGKESCSVTASESVFGATNCDGSHTKKLVVEAVC